MSIHMVQNWQKSEPLYVLTILSQSQVSCCLPCLLASCTIPLPKRGINDHGGPRQWLGFAALPQRSTDERAGKEAKPKATRGLETENGLLLETFTLSTFSFFAFYTNYKLREFMDAAGCPCSHEYDLATGIVRGLLAKSDW